MAIKYVLFSLFFTFASFFIISDALATDTYEFTDPVTEQRYKTLTKELRCPKCQNQNLADSNAMQAGDLRREIYLMLNEGKTDSEIVDFMVYRYGDFVLYRPKVNSLTYILWFAPLALIVIGAIVITVLVRRKTSQQDKAPLSAAEQAELNTLLNKENKQ